MEPSSLSVRAVRLEDAPAIMALLEPIIEAGRGEPVAIYGEPLFARIVAAQLGRVLLEPALDWLVHLPRALIE